MTSSAPSTSTLPAFTYIGEPSEGLELPSAQDLRAALEKGNDDLRLDVLRRVITATMNGTQYVSGRALSWVG